MSHYISKQTIQTSKKKYFSLLKPELIPAVNILQINCYKKLLLFADFQYDIITKNLEVMTLSKNNIGYYACRGDFGFRYVFLEAKNCYDIFNTVNASFSLNF